MASAESGSSCPHIDTCPMFPLFGLQGALEVWKIRYCKAQFTACERYKRAQSGLQVPPNLMPSGSLLRRGGP